MRYCETCGCSINLRDGDFLCTCYRAPQDTLRATGIEGIVVRDITTRQQHGIQKYGTTVDDNKLSRQQWLQHAYEETLDLAVYLRKCIKEEENGTVCRD